MKQIFFWWKSDYEKDHIYRRRKGYLSKKIKGERERVNVLDVQGTYRKVTEELWPPTMKIIEQKKTVRICLNQILGLSTLSDSTVSYHDAEKWWLYHCSWGPAGTGILLCFIFLFFYRPLCFCCTWSSILSIKLLLPKKKMVFSAVSLSVILNLIFNHNVFLLCYIYHHYNICSKRTVFDLHLYKTLCGSNCTKLCSHTHEFMCLNKAQFS